MRPDRRAPGPVAGDRKDPSYSRVLLRAPSPLVTVALIAVLDAALAALAWNSTTPVRGLAELLLGVFLIPALAAGVLTGPLAELFGGRLSLRRSVLLALSSTAVAAPVLLLWRLLTVLPTAATLPVAIVLLFFQGPVLWFRHMSLFGLSNPSHARSLPASAIQPALALVGIFLLTPPTVSLLVAAVLFLVIAFLCCALLLRAADRPLRREFGMSGVSLIRPLLDHINDRDAGATEILEGFFVQKAIPANLRITLLAFFAGGRAKATIALPTVHPGPFAALGASDLPRKLSERLGPASGTVFVPHTPCDHDLDLPTTADVDRVGEAGRGLLDGLSPPASSDVSRLVSPRPGSLARAQLLGDAVLVLVSQAPDPTDDIAFAIADQLVHEYEGPDQPRLALIDAHNSYIHDRGDVSYGTPQADRLMNDARQAIAEAVRSRRPGPLEVGVGVRTGYSIGKHGIGPEGIRALVTRADGHTAAYVLIDGNNLLHGFRAPILEGLRGVVDEAEVMTTDNHVVHEVDGGINPVGERYPLTALLADIRAVVELGKADLSIVEPRVGSRNVPNVRVLGPAYTARLLTSLGDTLSMFANAFLTTYLLLLASSLVVLVWLR